ncbi:MAG: hypothetical protein J5819_01570 [Eubacterium sp.]|nr:hypothetical protein [Eubacterium sp.]
MKKNRKISWLMTPVLVLALIAGVVGVAPIGTELPVARATGASVQYMDIIPTYFDNSLVVGVTPEEKTANNVTEINNGSSSAVTWGSTSDTWYAVKSNVTFDDRITISGHVHLILCDGMTLTACKGITIDSPNSLSIYAQSAGTGKLHANSNSIPENAAGIGGNDSMSGKINIYGGEIIANGGANAAGIGGGGSRCDGNLITINGGEVTATGGSGGAGIGGGLGGNGSNIIINGGTVKATGGNGGAGIGGGQAGSASNIQINGGTVVSAGKDGGAGIGGGNTCTQLDDSAVKVGGSAKVSVAGSVDSNSSSNHCGAGIGGGCGANTDGVEIDGVEIGLNYIYNVTANSAMLYYYDPRKPVDFMANDTSYNRNIWRKIPSATVTSPTSPAVITLNEGYSSPNTFSVSVSIDDHHQITNWQWFRSTTENSLYFVHINDATTPTYTFPTGMDPGTYYLYLSCNIGIHSIESYSSSTVKNYDLFSRLVHVATVTVNGSSGQPAPNPPAPVSPSQSNTSPSSPSSPYVAPATDPQPQINGGEGWSTIENTISSIPDGGSEVINMNGTTQLPSHAIRAIQGHNVNLVLDMGGGIKWTINGQDMDGAGGDVQMGVYLGVSGVPIDVINNLTGSREKMNLMLSRDGGPGFKATLTLPLKKEWSGLVANLFNFNKITNGMDFVSSGVVGADGSTDLVIGEEKPSAGTASKDLSLAGSLQLASADEASSFYTIVIDDHSLDPNPKPTAEPTPTPAVEPVPTAEPTQTPAPVLTLKAESKNKKIQLKWNKLAEAKKYRVIQLINGQQKTVKTQKGTTLTIDKAWKPVKKKKKNKTVIQWLDLKAGRKYTFVVRALIDGEWTEITDSSTVTVKVKK